MRGAVQMRGAVRLRGVVQMRGAVRLRGAVQMRGAVQVLGWRVRCRSRDPISRYCSRSLELNICARKMHLKGKSKIGNFLSKIHSPREVRIDTHAGRPMTYKHVML